MKIIHYATNIYKNTGGLEKYVRDLAEFQSYEDEVIVAFSGKYKTTKKNKFKGKYIGRIKTIEIDGANPITLRGIAEPEDFMRRGDFQAYKEFFEKEKPDILHVHTLLGAQPEMFRAAKENYVKIIYTTHDYFGLCPKVNWVKNGTFCGEICGEQCGQCCKNGENAKDVLKRQLFDYMRGLKFFIRSVVVRDEKLSRIVSQYMMKEKKEVSDIRNQKSYVELRIFFMEMYKMVDYYHFNSCQTEEEFRKNINGIRGQVEYLFHQDILDRRKIRKMSGALKISFLGNPIEHKGFFLLKEVLDDLYYIEKKHFVLNLYVQLRQNDDDYIKYHNPYTYHELEKVMNEADLIVVPSVCKETFSFTVLEAISCGVPVLISTNVAAKEWCEAYGGLADVVSLDKESIKSRIRKYIDNRELLEIFNQIICEKNINFSYEDHVVQIRKIYKNLLRDNEE